MKKNFLRILPIAAAVLLATSCSKDNDDNTIVENNAAQENVGNTVVDNNAAQENVEAVHDFALTVSNSESLSKVSLATPLGTVGTKYLKFDEGDVLYISFDDPNLKESFTSTYYKSEALKSADISADGKSATFHFTQTEFDGKTADDVTFGYMGILDIYDEETFWAYESLDEALRYSYRRLDLDSWTLYNQGTSYINMNSTTSKKVEVSYYDLDEDDDVTTTLEAGKAYCIYAKYVTVYLNGEKQEVTGGKIYNVK